MLKIHLHVFRRSLAARDPITAKSVNKFPNFKMLQIDLMYETPGSGCLRTA